MLISLVWCKPLMVQTIYTLQNKQLNSVEQWSNFHPTEERGEGRFWKQGTNVAIMSGMRWVRCPALRTAQYLHLQWRPNSREYSPWIVMPSELDPAKVGVYEYNHTETRHVQSKWTDAVSFCISEMLELIVLEKINKLERKVFQATLKT